MIKTESLNKIYVNELARMVEINKEDYTGAISQTKCMVRSYIDIRNKTKGMVDRGETPPFKLIQEEFMLSLAIIGMIHSLDVTREELASEVAKN
jgi:hypothetical protein